MNKRQRPRVMILGAGRALVRSIAEVKAAGFEVIAVDELPMPFAFRSADIGVKASPQDPSAIARAIKDVGGIDGVVATNEPGLVALARLAPEFSLLALSLDSADLVASKLRQRRAMLERATEWAVPFEVVTDPDSIVTAASRFGWPLIVKPDRSAGGSRGVSLVEHPAAAAGAFSFARDAAGGHAVLVEPALEGPQFSCEVLCAEGRLTVLAIGRKSKSPPPYRVDMAVIYPSGLSHGEFEAVEQMVQATIEALNLQNTALHIEFAMTAAGPRVIEVNGRVGGGFTPSLVEASIGTNPLVEHCRLACRLPVRWPTPGPERGAVYGFTAYPPGLATGYTIPAAVAEDSHVIDVSMFLPRDGVIRPLQWTSQRVGQIGVSDETAEAALNRSDALSRLMTVRYDDGSERAPLS